MVGNSVGNTFDFIRHYKQYHFNSLIHMVSDISVVYR